MVIPILSLAAIALARKQGTSTAGSRVDHHRSCCGAPIEIIRLAQKHCEVCLHGRAGRGKGGRSGVRSRLGRDGDDEPAVRLIEVRRLRESAGQCQAECAAYLRSLRRSDVDLLADLDRVPDVDTEEADGTFDLRDRAGVAPRADCCVEVETERDERSSGVLFRWPRTRLAALHHRSPQ